MNQLDAEQFAEDWVAAWNAHDLPAVLAHYADDFSMSSPLIAELVGEPTGTLHGKAAVGSFWRNALIRFPDLRFRLLSVLAGTESVVVHYVSVGARAAAEVFFLDSQGKVVRAFAHYRR